ncbi:MAG: TonB family protein [Vibrio sp.]
MNIHRYVMAGGISIALHGLLLITTNHAQVFAMPAGNPSQSVAINLVAQPKPAAPTQPEPVLPAKAQLQKTTPKPATVAKPKPAKIAKPVAATSAKPPLSRSPITEPVEHTTHSVASPVRPSKPSQGISSQPMLIDQPAFVSTPVQPRYPRIAQKRGIEGTVLYEIWLDEQGRQIKQQLISSSGAQVLDQSALEAIKQWQFSPRILDGAPVAHRVHIPVRFKLEG